MNIIGMGIVLSLDIFIFFLSVKLMCNYNMFVVVRYSNLVAIRSYDDANYCTIITSLKAAQCISF